MKRIRSASRARNFPEYPQEISVVSMASTFRHISGFGKSAIIGSEQSAENLLGSMPTTNPFNGSLK